MRYILKVICLLFFLSAAALEADTVVLKEGQRMTGDILAERNDLLVFDLGIEILTIAKDKILQYEYTESYEPESVESESSGEDFESDEGDHKLFRTADLSLKSIEDCIEDVSEAVIKVSTPAGLGSGFFINEEGYLITNYHVIERETLIEVTLFQKVRNGFEKKNFKKVKIVAINPFLDLALLKVEDLGETRIKYATLGNGDDIKIGEKVFAIGNPLGLERTVTDGVISTTSRSFEGLVYLQTNTDINPGNSGGPLFNLKGEVIGVTNMGYIFFGGLGFAIPIDYVKHFIENRDAFAYDKDNPNTGYRYVQPDRRQIKDSPAFLKNSN